LVHVTLLQKRFESVCSLRCFIECLRYLDRLQLTILRKVKAREVKRFVQFFSKTGVLVPLAGPTCRRSNAFDEVSKLIRAFVPSLSIEECAIDASPLGTVVACINNVDGKQYVANLRPVAASPSVLATASTTAS